MQTLAARLELKIPPVPLAALAALAMWLLARRVPAWRLDLPWRGTVALMLALTGIAVVLAGVAAFRRARTTVNPMQPASASHLVARGIYGHTRNPMYLGLLLVLAGWAWYLGNLAAMLVLPLFVAYVHRFQILPEERALAASFGDDFTAYRSATRRWI
jgi:protein-S-isoprenylcysteine O-methyltransferase Ste14